MVDLTFVGFIAGGLVLISLIPQIIKSWKTKRTGDLSLLMYIIYVFGVISWLTYGIILRDPPMIVTNSIMLLFASSILYLKIKYG